MKLYHYWRSSSSWRVRWALELKSLKFEAVHVGLLDGESESPEHLKRNPLGFVPVLEIPGYGFLSESVSIIEWLDETYPEPKLLWGDSFQRAKIRQLVEVINSDTQPLQNLNPMHRHSDDPEKRKQWAQYWIKNGLHAYEKLLPTPTGNFSLGERISAADLFLIPQCYNANRFEINLGDFPKIAQIFAHAQTLPSYQASAPERYEPKAT